MKLSAILEPLVAAGVDPETLLKMVRAYEEQQENALEKRRQADRDRQARKRLKDEKSRDVTLCHSDSQRSRSRARVEDNLLTKDISGKEDNKVTSPPARSKRGERIPDDFQPDIDAAVSEGVPRPEAERQARSFCDYWRAKPGKDGLKLDWPATWRVWYRRNMASPQARATAPPPKQTVGQQARDELRRMGLLGNATDNQNRHEHQSDGGADSASPGIARRFAIASSR
jgi:hypothetical protein